MGWSTWCFTNDVIALSSAAPADIGTAAAVGSGTTIARSDHVHKIGTGAINASNLFAAGVVGATALASGAVTEAKIASGAVIAGKMGTGAISASNLFGAGVVSGSALASGAVTSAKMAAGCISAAGAFSAGVVNDTAIAPNAATTTKFADGAVTVSKLSIDANLAFNQKQAVGLVIHTSDTAPNSGSEVDGQLWYDSANKKLKVWRSS